MVVLAANGNLIENVLSVGEIGMSPADRPGNLINWLYQYHSQWVF